MYVCLIRRYDGYIFVKAAKSKEFYQTEYNKEKNDYYSKDLAELHLKELRKIDDKIKEIKNYRLGKLINEYHSNFS